MTPAEETSTKQALLDAAEVLFGEQGFTETSLRDITSRAGANLAAVNYHFGSKEELLKQVLVRRFGPLNQERIDLIEAALAEAGEGRPDLEKVIYGFIAPTFRVQKECPSCMQIMAWNTIRPAFDEQEFCGREALFPELIQVMRHALIQALPGASSSDIWWSVNFMLGSMVFTWLHHGKWEVLSQGEATYESDEAMINLLVTYSAAGLRKLQEENR